MNKKQFIWLISFIALAAVILLSDSKMLSQPNKLKGGFQEVAFYRNQNNVGPVVRIYSVTVKNIEEANYEAYGNAMPYTLHGNTKVYFFDERNPAPTTLSYDFPHFDGIKYKPVKLYERNGADIVHLEDYKDSY